MGVLTACASRPPVYDPLPVTAPSNGRDVVVQVRPLDTRLGSDDRRRYGVDIGAYFAAFLVAVENRTTHALAVDLAHSTLGDSSGESVEVLSDEDLVRIYRRGGMSDSAVELVAKAPAVVKREIEQIRAARMVAGELAPGARTEGVLFFRPLATGDCARSVLTIRGIETVDERQPFEFAFPLDPCGARRQGVAPSGSTGGGQ